MKYKKLPKGSAALHKRDPNAVYDVKQTELHSQISSNNTYNVFLRHKPSSAWYRKFCNDLMRGNGKGICEKCECF